MNRRKSEVKLDKLPCENTGPICKNYVMSPVFIAQIFRADNIASEILEGIWATVMKRQGGYR